MVCDASSGHDGRRQKVVVNNITKCYGHLLVLKEVSFSVLDGEFLCIVGPTGCGKTTFLNCLARLIPLTAGEILIDGEPADPRRHHMAYVFQEPSVMPWLTVRENVRFGLDIKRVPRPEANRRVEELLQMVGLDAFADHYPSQLSASMLQRVVIARAFAVRPDLLLMDEPYGQLDLNLRYNLEEELLRIWETMKTTVIFVTHNIEEAVYLAERILVLSAKPTRIKHEIEVNLPRPRDFASPEFVEIRNGVTEMIKWW